MDVMALERELSDEPDPHATLPFISHHTLNLSRDLEEETGGGGGAGERSECVLVHLGCLVCLSLLFFIILLA